jgi:uridine kinase
MLTALHSDTVGGRAVDEALFKAVRMIQVIRKSHSSTVVVGVGGPAGSGKASLVARLAKVVTGVTIIRLMDYIDPSRVTPENEDEFHVLDISQLEQDLQTLKHGQPIRPLRFNFRTRQRGYG